MNNTSNFLKQFISYLKPYLGRISVMYIFALMNVAAMISIPLFIQQTIDLGIVPGDGQKLIQISLIVLGLSLLQFISFSVQGRLMMRIGNRLLFTFRRDVFEKMQQLSQKFFDTNKSGKLLTRVTSDVMVMEELLMAGLDTVLVDVLMIIGLISAMVFLNPWLSMVLLIIIPTLAVIVFVLRNKIVSVADGIQRRLSGLNSFLNESLSGIRVIQAFAREKKNIENFHSINDEYYSESRKFYPLNAYFWQSVATLNVVSQGLVVLVGGILLHRGMISIGIIVAYLSYVTRLFQPMQKISNMLNQLSKAVVSGNRIFEILAEPVHVQDVEDAIDQFKLEGRVEFKDVEFAYKADEPVLRGISFQLPKGKMCAIVGHTGSGKSTTVNLVNRFYDTTGGTIYIDGRDIKSYAQRSLRSQMASVMQEPQIFSGSVADNIRFGKPDASDHEVQEVAKTLGIHDMIMSFPNAYDTELGQNGDNISLGQKQLLAFARALLRNPAILILDEASAYLDSETEVMIQDALKKLMNGRTSFVIAHRLSTIRHADIILVLEQGEIVEQGNHDELVAMNGVYAGYVSRLNRNEA